MRFSDKPVSDESDLTVLYMRGHIRTYVRMYIVQTLILGIVLVCCPLCVVHSVLACVVYTVSLYV